MTDYDPHEGSGVVCFLAGVATCLAWIIFLQVVWR